MVYHAIWVSIYSFKCLKTVWSGLFTSTLFSPCSYRLDRNGMLLKFLYILITVMYFKDWNWISETVNCISCSVVCKIVFCSEFPDIPDNAGKVTRRRRRRRTQVFESVFTCLWFHKRFYVFTFFNNFFLTFKNIYSNTKIKLKATIRIPVTYINY